MPKGCMISAHRSPADPEKAAAYRKTAKSALAAAGGKFLAGGGQVEAYESDAYQEALRALDGGADRDIRLLEGI